MIFKNDADLCRHYDIPESSFRQAKKRYSNLPIIEIVKICLDRKGLKGNQKTGFYGYRTKKEFCKHEGISEAQLRYFMEQYPSVNGDEMLMHLRAGTKPDLAPQRADWRDEYRDVKEKPIKRGFYIFRMQHYAERD